MKKVTYFPYHKVKDEREKKDIDKIMYQLEKYGRAETNNSRTPRTLAFRYKEAKNEGLINFAWSKKQQKSLIVLKPGVKIKSTSPQRRKFKFEFD